MKQPCSYDVRYECKNRKLRTKHGLEKMNDTGELFLAFCLENYFYNQRKFDPTQEKTKQYRTNTTELVCCPL